MMLNIGGNIKGLRAEKGVTQEQLAAHLSITYQSVSKWENDITAPDLYLIPQIAEYFEVSIDELFKPSMRGYKNRAQRLLAVYEHTGRKEDFDKAEAEYEKIFCADNADGEDMRSYGVLNEYRSYALAAKAEKLYRQAISMGTEAESQLLYLLSKTGRNEENIANRKETLKNAPDNVRNWRLLVCAYEYAKMPEKALETAGEGLVKFPDNAGLLSSCGDLCRSLKKYDEAVGYHERAISCSPSLGGSYYSLAFIFQDLKQYGKAIGAWERVVEFCKKNGLDVEIRWPLKEIAKLRALLENNAA